MEKLLKTTPIKKPMMLITTAAMLFALRFILGFLSISLGPTVLSFTWISLFIAGFTLGPVFGLTFGIITDSFGFLISRGSKIWMWQYAMQEPLICLFGGLLYLLYKTINTKKQQAWLMGIYQFIILTCTIFATTMILYYFDESAAREGGDVTYADSYGVKVAGIILMFIFYFISAIIPFYRWKKDKEVKVYIFSALLVYVPWALFSWSFGAYFYSLWWLRINPGSELRDNWFIFYSLSRILKSMFVIPIEIFTTYALLKALMQYAHRSEYIQFT